MVGYVLAYIMIYIHKLNFSIFVLSIFNQYICSMRTTFIKCIAIIENLFHYLQLKLNSNPKF